MMITSRTIAQTNLSSLRLRPIRAKDAPELARLRAAGLIEQGFLSASDVREFHSTAIREIFTMIRSGELEGWLAETPTRAVGCACVVFWRRLPYAEGNLHAEISGVYVEPEQRRFGIATELVREAVGAARSRGARNVTLTPKENSRAMYERLGFIDCDRMLLNLSSQAAARTATSPLE